jgi:hypothetical protein
MKKEIKNKKDTLQTVEDVIDTILGFIFLIFTGMFIIGLIGKIFDKDDKK